MTLKGLRTLIQVNHKITSEDTDKLIYVLTTDMNKIIYNYEYRSERFIPYESLVKRGESEVLPSAVDLDFAVQEFGRFKGYAVDMNLDTKSGITYDALNNYFKHLFKPKDIFVPPILAYLQLLELLIVGGVDNIIIL